MASSYFTTKKYLEQKYQDVVYLTEEQVRAETLEASVVHLQDEATGLYILSDVARHISQIGVQKTKSSSKNDIIAEYTAKLERYWQKISVL